MMHNTNNNHNNNISPLQLYFDIPIVSRIYLTACVLTTVACSLDLLSDLNLYYNYKLIVLKGQTWRLITNFIFFGLPGLDFIFHMYFLVRYCRLLEDNSFRARTADFLCLFMFGMVSMTLIGPFLDIPFFGSSLTFMMVYVWARRNEQVKMSFLGLFPFQACYLPWVQLSFSFLLGGGSMRGVLVDGIGIAVGHIYYYFDDVLPEIARIRGWKPRYYLRAPWAFKVLVNSILGEVGGDSAFESEANRPIPILDPMIAPPHENDQQ